MSSVRGKRIKTDLVESDDVNGKKLTFSSFAAHFNLNQSSTQNNEQTLRLFNFIFFFHNPTAVLVQNFWSLQCD